MKRRDTIPLSSELVLILALILLPSLSKPPGLGNNAVMSRKGSRTIRAPSIVLSLMVSLLGISCQSFSQGDRQQTARGRDGLYGPVRTMEIVRATLVKKDGEWEIETEQLVQRTSYDRQGQKTEQRVYAEDGSLAEILHFRYTDHGQISEIQRDTSQAQLITRTTFTYNAAARLVESRIYSVQNGTETVAGRESFSYAEAGQQQTVQHYGPAGTLLSRIESSSNEQGHVLQKKWYDAKGSLTRMLERHTDYQGALVSENVYDYASDGRVTKRVDIRYNTHGEPQERIEYQEQGRFKREQRFTYQADAFGNWTLQTMTTRTIRDESPSFEPPVVVARTFTYFDREDS